MLQQTQVSRVLVKYPEFLQRFPTIKTLAAARQRDVVIAWQGMGYNNRAVRLHQLAMRIVQQHGGKFPQTYEELVTLPGIGRYTANALLSSAFRKNVPIVDINVRRVLSRIFWRMKTNTDMKPEREIWTLADVLVPKVGAYDWNQALMDLGATICTARVPLCTDCPVKTLCRSCNYMKRAPSGKAKQEPSRDGIPNRIYRGRIVETLRTHQQQLRPGVIGKAIHPKYSVKSKAWLESLLAGLEKDGVIVQTPKGTWNERRIGLA